MAGSRASSRYRATGINNSSKAGLHSPLAVSFLRPKGRCISTASFVHRCTSCTPILCQRAMRPKDRGDITENQTRIGVKENQAGSRPNISTQPQRKPRGRERGDTRHPAAELRNSPADFALACSSPTIIFKGLNVLPSGAYVPVGRVMSAPWLSRQRISR